jgi:hypothetical protein
MIAHVVLFAPKAHLPEESRQEVLDALTAAASEIPSIRRFRVGRRLRHGLPGYEQAMRVDFEYVVLIEFDDEAGLRAYLQHPSHSAAGTHFTTSSAAALAYDYEIVEAADAKRLVETPRPAER